MTYRRTDLDTLSIDELLRRGIAAARVGEVEEAQLFLTEVTSRDADRADAWLWLASVEPNPQVKRDDFERVLALRPDDAGARDGLDRLIEKYGRAVLQKGDEVDVLHCYWHPDRETGLRCARCNKPICPECARRHPVGWRCKECAKELRSPIYKVTPAQIARGLAVGTVVSCGAAAAMYLLGMFWILPLFVAPAAGTFVADLTSRGAGGKRGRGVQVVAGAAVVLGAGILFWATSVGLLRGVLPGSWLGLLFYVVLGAGTAFYRLR